jgi:hypothetical protein
MDLVRMKELVEERRRKDLVPGTPEWEKFMKELSAEILNKHRPELDEDVTRIFDDLRVLNDQITDALPPTGPGAENVRNLLTEMDGHVQRARQSLQDIVALLRSVGKAVSWAVEDAGKD